MYGLERGVTSINGTEHVFDCMGFDLRGGRRAAVLGGKELIGPWHLMRQVEAWFERRYLGIRLRFGVLLLENEPAAARDTRRSTRRTMTTSAPILAPNEAGGS